MTVCPKFWLRIWRWNFSGDILPGLFGITVDENLDPPLHTPNQRKVQTIDTQRSVTKDDRNGFVGRKDYGIILGFSWNYFGQLLTNGEYLANLLQQLGDKIKDKRPHLVREKMLSSRVTHLFRSLQLQGPKFMNYFVLHTWKRFSSNSFF